MKLELTFLTWRAVDAPPDHVFVSCVETLSLGSALNFNESQALEKCLEHIQWELSERLRCNNLKYRGWIINEHKIIPPLITKEEAIEKQKKSLLQIGYPENFNTFEYFKKVIDVPIALK